jgi:hypothetical protein
LVKLISFSIGILGGEVAVKILECLHEMIEEIEEEYLVLRDLSNHSNLPAFYGLYLLRGPKAADQLWIAMEVLKWMIIEILYYVVGYLFYMLPSFTLIV